MVNQELAHVLVNPDGSYVPCFYTVKSGLINMLI